MQFSYVTGRRTGLVLATTVLLAGMTIPAQAASNGLDPANRLGDIILTPTSGALAAATDPQLLATEVGCPEGYRGSSRTMFIWEDGTQASKFPALVQSTVKAGVNGLDGLPMARTGDDATRWVTAGFPLSSFRTGLATYVVTCEQGVAPDGTYPAVSQPVGEARYFSVDVRIDVDAKTWAVEQGPEKTATTTTLTADAVTTTSATLTASVSPTSATGDVTFKQDGTSIGTVNVVDGLAALPVQGLNPSTTYSFTAQYSGDDVYASSTSSAAPVSTLALPEDQVSASDVTVDVPVAASEPQAPTGLKISVEPGAVTLTGPAERAAGQAWTATGQLGNVTVNDDRQDATGGAWTLNGKSSAFTSGSNTIAASNLGWTPTKVTGPGSAGATATDLSSDKPLATGTATTDPNAATTVGAGLTLVVPATAANGAYTATLTLTLI